MAEFQEVMRQYDRMCSHYEECAGCPFHRNVIWCIKKIGGKRYVNENARPAEEIIMAWAAKHPEPVYPSYIEVFGWAHKKTWAEIKDILANPIPADLAKKLNVDPKEVT